MSIARVVDFCIVEYNDSIIEVESARVVGREGKDLKVEINGVDMIMSVYDYELLIEDMIK